MKQLFNDNDLTGLLQTIKELSADNNKTILILFTGSKDPSGISWCPDCTHSEPIIHQVINDDNYAGDDYILITTYVGDRNTWKDSQNWFRTHKDLKINCVPTLVNWKSKNRLTETQLTDRELINILIED